MNFSVNKIYKIIWSRTKNCYVVASELAKGHGKATSLGIAKKTSLALAISLALGGSLSGNAVWAAQGPEDKTSTATGTNSVAFGGATANGQGTVALAGGIASGDGSIAIGEGAEAADGALAINGQASNGAYAAIKGYSDGSQTLTFGGSALGMMSQSMGVLSYADGEGALSYGFRAAAVGDNTISIGREARADNNDSVVIGAMASAQGAGDVSIGKEAVANGGIAILGTLNQDLEDEPEGGSVAVLGKVDGNRSYTIGGLTEGDDSLSIGSRANVDGNYSYAIGVNSSAISNHGIAIGDYAVSKADSTQAIGEQAQVWSSGGTAIGSWSSVDKDSPNAVAIGYSTAASADKASALGAEASADKANSVALGANSLTNKDFAVVTATSEITKGTGSNAVATKFGNFAGTATGVVSIGNVGAERQIINVAPGEVSAFSTDAINGSQLFTVADQVVQNQADIKAVTSTADSTAKAVNEKGITFAGDTGSKVTKKLGEEVKVFGGKTNTDNLTNNNIGVVAGTEGLEVKLAEKVDLGSQGQLTVGSTIINPASITTNSLAITGGPSMDKAGINAGNKKITNVLAGTNSTDAVNYGQLTSELDKVKPEAGNNITIDGPSEANGNKYVINGLKTTVSTSDKYIIVTPGAEVEGTTDYAISLSEATKAAIDSIDDKIDKKDVASVAQSSIAVEGTEPNVTVTSSADSTGKLTYNVALNKELDLTKDGSITIGDTVIDGTKALVADTTINADGITTNKLAITGGPSMDKAGINAGNKVISGVAKGIKGTDAVNVDQLNASLGELETKVTSNIQYTFAGDVATGDGSSEFVRKTGDTIKVTGGAEAVTDVTKLSEGNIGVVVDSTNGELAVKLAQNLNLTNTGSISIGDTVVDSNHIAVAGTTINDQGISTVGNITLSKDGIYAGDKQIKGVAEGIADTDAVNVSQLRSELGKAVSEVGLSFAGDLGNTVKVNNGGTLNISGGIKEANKLVDGNIGVIGTDKGLSVQLAKDLTGLNSVTTGNTAINHDGLTIKGKDGKDGAVIREDGMAIKGKDGKDKVVVKENKVDVGGNVIQNVGDGLKPNEAVNRGQLDAVEDRVDGLSNGFGNLNGRVNKLDRRVDKVGAGAAALAALNPLDFNPDDKWNFAVGYGYYKDTDAIAMGAYYQPNEDTRFSVGGAIGNGDNMINAGVSLRFGQSNGVSTSRVALAKDVESLKRIVQQLVTENEQLRRGGHGATSGYPDISDREFPDVPKNHWAYEYVDTITKKGFTIGYPDGEFKGDRTLTRYEFAAVVYRALKNGAEIDGGMARAIDEFGPELARLEGLDHSRVDRVAGEDNDRYKIERLRVNNKDNEETNDYRDIYGSKIQKEEVAQ